MKKIVVISLGGSLIVPNKIDTDFLKKFKKTLFKNKRKYKFVIVCGGGKTARNYIKALENQKLKKKEQMQTELGITATRLNAEFMKYFCGEKVKHQVPDNMKDVKNLLRKNNIVFCGALRKHKRETTDSTAAKLANYLNTDFINLTNVKGLYDKNPKKSRKAKFIPLISHKKFYKMAKKIEFKPGQHFILDQKSAKIIKKNKINTYILGSDTNNLNRLLNKKHFIGTKIRS